MMPGWMNGGTVAAVNIRESGEEVCGRSTGKKKGGQESWW